MLEWVLVPLVGAFIGWITNLLAIALLFRPRRPWRFPGGLVLQGLLPKRREELARTVAVTVEKELLPSEDIAERFCNPRLKEEIVGSVAEAVSERLKNRLPRFLPPAAAAAIVNYVVEITRKEAGYYVDRSLERLATRVKEDLKLSEIVEGRLAAFSLDDMERLIYSVSARELKHIEVMGGVLGFLIGLAQVGAMKIARAM
ncbi:MAG: DUF445 family protein [Actinobacteria bacterium]|nr:DUF445 family protein [Actinomycetota bacterium]